MVGTTKKSSAPPVHSHGFIILLFLMTTGMLGGAAGAATWIVDDDGGPGVDFLDIPDAVAAASPGDLILVRDGIYSGFDLTKELQILADTGHHPEVAGDSRIADLLTGQSAVISGLRLRLLDIRHSRGNILVDDCMIANPTNTGNLLITTCDMVTVSRCHIQDIHLASSECAAIIKDAQVILSECTLIGGDGSDNWDADAEDGASGLTSTESTLYIQSSSIRGGDGGNNWGLWGNGGNGGRGIFVQSCTLHLFGTEDHVIQGGEGGDSEAGIPGTDAPAVEASYSNVLYSGVSLVTGVHYPAIYYYNQSVVTEMVPPVPVITVKDNSQLNGSIDIKVHGDPGSAFSLFFAFDNAVNPVGNLITHLQLDPGAFFYLLSGVIPPGNPAEYTISLPSGGPALMGISLHLQGYVLVNGVTPYLSTSSTFVLRCP
jgi:hypothetical protein